MTVYSSLALLALWWGREVLVVDAVAATDTGERMALHAPSTHHHHDEHDEQHEYDSPHSDVHVQFLLLSCGIVASAVVPSTCAPQAVMSSFEPSS